MKKSFISLCLVTSLCFSMVSSASKKDIDLEAGKDESKSEEIIKGNFLVNIDENLFSSTSVRLNKELYEITENIVNEKHLEQCFKSSATPLYNSYKKLVNPLVPLAITLCESGTWMDSKYTWCSAIYSKQLAEAGVDMGSLEISAVDANTYLANGIVGELGCGSNCTARNSIGNKHIHMDGGLNDNDSLGPLQILRRYVESTAGIAYPCGAVTYDLMSWEDNVNYFFHKQSEIYAKNNHWNSSHEVKSVYELVALMGVMHNTGGAFQTAATGKGKAGSKWKNAKAVYDYCQLLGSETSIKVLSSYVDSQYETIVKNIKEGSQFRMAGQLSWKSGQTHKLLEDIGVIESDYVNGGFGHKQIYPLRAILNYMTLERLYTSGGVKGK